MPAWAQLARCAASPLDVRPAVRYPRAIMRVLILGGDGYLGWPTAMRFSSRGHDVAVVDNFSRRHWHALHSTDSLTPIRSLRERVDAWKDVTAREIEPFV